MSIPMNINDIVAQQIKDLQPKPIPFIQPSIQPPMTGMQEHCYQVGFDHASPNVDINGPDVVGDALDVLPCQWSETNHQAYTQGFINGLGL